MVENGKNGYLLKSPIRYFNEDFTPNKMVWGKVNLISQEKTFHEVVRGLSDKISLLLEDQNLRVAMGRHSLGLVKKCRFSERCRKESLAETYLSI